MRVLSMNVNGIRAVSKKGFFTQSFEPVDFLCLQEARCDELHLPLLPSFTPYACPAIKKGYSGVAIYSKKTPALIQKGFGVREFDEEGRYLELVFDNFILISLYAPSGSSSALRQAAKFRFLDAFFAHLQDLRKRGQEILICGDWNIAHTEKDLKNWRQNQNYSGFLPEERAWLSRVFDELGYVDVFRMLNQEPHQYTWWSNRGNAYANNVGWRIDYQVATPMLAKSAKEAMIHKEPRYSDHAPLVIDYDWR